MHGSKVFMCFIPSATAYINNKTRSYGGFHARQLIISFLRATQSELQPEAPENTEVTGIRYF